MESIRREVNESVLLINDLDYDKKHNSYYHYDKIMAFGGDNFKGVCESLQIGGEQALLVNGSGDQPIELIYQNFKEIDVFDINLLSRHMLNLKIAAIKALNYQEFELFSKMLFKNTELFQKVLFFLAEETKKYFKLLFTFKPKREIYDGLFTHKYSPICASMWEYSQQNFSVYNENEFYEIKYKLLNDPNLKIRFWNFDLFHPQKFTKKYDFIYFSNILLFQDWHIDFFVSNLLPKYRNLLKENGCLIFFYMHYFYVGLNHGFETNDYFDRYTQRKNTKIYEELKNSIEIEKRIPASGFGYGLGDADMVLALKKKHVKFL